ncbi:MAG: hypothetical protein HYR94_00825, partial [Chloroflexi bacterium]|nr:hypothetical protein [Chloroflexota bacterium]
DDLRLLGYDLPARRVQPGQTLALTLYWQSLQVTWRDYFVFTHLLDEGQNRRGGLEQRLLEGYPVSAWHPGQIVADQRQISIDPAAPAGLTWLRVGVYELANNQAVPQSLIIDGQPSQETSLALGPILVGPPPPPDQPPQIPLSISLGQPPLIRLVGYNLTPAAHALNLVLYWESLAPTPVDWTLFVQLRHQAGEIIAQKDGPVGGGRFPSSLWQPGEVVADEILLPLQTRPSESDELVVGLYNLARGTRLAVPNHAANEIVLIHEWARLPEY